MTLLVMTMLWMDLQLEPADQLIQSMLHNFCCCLVSKANCCHMQPTTTFIYAPQHMKQVMPRPTDHDTSDDVLCTSVSIFLHKHLVLRH